MQRLLKLFIIVALTFSVITPGVAIAATDASKEALCGGAGLVGGGQGCTASSGTSSVDSVLKKGLNLFSAIIGIIAVVMIMVGGLKYMTSQGDSANVASAKNTILYAVIGLVVVALAQVIVKFVLDRFA